MKLINKFEDGIKENEDNMYIASVEIHNTPINLWQSDYGQCYFFTFKNKDDIIEEIGCGTYNFNYLEEIVSFIDPKGAYISIDGQEAWDELMKMRADRGLKNIDYDDYEIYDFESMYKLIEKDE